MEQAKILIVEDELITAQRIKATLEKSGYKVIGIAANGADALKEMRRESANLVLMDIYLNGRVEGIITAKALKQNYATSIIYITKLKDEQIFLDAKETFPKNYLSKPFSNRTLVRAVELAIQQPEYVQPQQNVCKAETILSDRLFVQTNEGCFQKLLLSDILYIHSNGSYAFVYFIREGENEIGHYRVSQNSKKLAERLADKALVKVHKSFFVNMLRIERIKDADIVIKGTDTVVPIGREFRSNLDEKLKFLKHNPE